jgi:hypothetical protein
MVTKVSDKDFSTTYPDILKGINDYFPEYLKEKIVIYSDEEGSD